MVNIEILEEKMTKLEQQLPQTFLDINCDIYNYDKLHYIYNFLYHGIRHQKHLEILESIFKDKAILAGNYQENNNYSNYSDNCNEGEYVSLVDINNDYDLEYTTFVKPYITLLISPDCGAIKTIYLPYEEWTEVVGKNTSNRYSYVHNEYHVKKMIPLSYVKAIGVPARYLRDIGNEEKIERYLTDILELMNKYNINLPIVDTSAYNIPLEKLATNIRKKLKRSV